MKRYALIGFLFLSVLSCKNETHTIVRHYRLASEIETPITENSHLSRLFATDSLLYSSWVVTQGDSSSLYLSKYDGIKWSMPEWIISGEDWFVNWADFPALAVNERGDILTNFLQKSDTATYSYDAKLNHYNAQTETWTKDFILHNDATKSEHGFVSIQPYAFNSFVITWLDGRETAGASHGKGQMTLRAAIVFDNATIDHDTLLDDRVCDCCQTSTAIGTKDQIFVAYRDRSEDEIRDISITNWTSENDWSGPQTIGNDQWKIAGCPVNGPAIDTFHNSVVVAWFSAPQEEGIVHLAFSSDNGTTFQSPIRIDNGNATGRVAVKLLSEAEALVLWMEPEDEGEVIQLAKVSMDGKIIKQITVTKTTEERASGFPQMELFQDTIYISWTEIKTSSSQVKMAKIPLEKL